jgi:hypothetical protein
VLFSKNFCLTEQALIDKIKATTGSLRFRKVAFQQFGCPEEDNGGFAWTLAIGYVAPPYREVWA